jgi:glycosyltransferase involved in cell wall biosynthesis
MFLRGAIASVLNQTFRDLEVIVVDDASNDTTLDVVSGFSDPRIRYVRHELQKGGAAARNTGIRRTAGEYIAFLDDDDEWFPEKLNLQVVLLDRSSSEVGAVYTGCIKVDHTSGKVLSQKTPTHRGDLHQRFLVKNCVTSTSSVVLRRQCLESVGLFDETLPSSQDHDMWIRISRGFHFESIPEPLFRYRVHEDKISTNLEACEDGIRRMIDKHGSHTSVWKRNFGYQGYIEIATLCCLRGDSGRAREAYLNAIRMFPFGIQAYLALCLCLVGTGAVTKTLAMKQRLTRRGDP